MDGQRIHIKTDENGGSVGWQRFPFDHGYNTRLANARADLQSQLAQVVGHNSGSAEFMEPKFWVLMEVAAPCHQLVKGGLGVLMKGMQQIHNVSSCRDFN
jgi:hypothetical protein